MPLAVDDTLPFATPTVTLAFPLGQRQSSGAVLGAHTPGCEGCDGAPDGGPEGGPERGTPVNHAGHGPQSSSFLKLPAYSAAYGGGSGSGTPRASGHGSGHASGHGTGHASGHHSGHAGGHAGGQVGSANSSMYPNCGSSALTSKTTASGDSSASRIELLLPAVGVETLFAETPPAGPPGPPPAGPPSAGPPPAAASRVYTASETPALEQLSSALAAQKQSTINRSLSHYRLLLPAGQSREWLDGLFTIFVFVNPTSGGNAAAAFTSAGLRHAMLGTEESPVEIYIYDIRDGASGAKPGFQVMKRVVSALPGDKYVCAVMAGGDGTVMWGASEIWEHGIDDRKVVVGVVPYGTGNDFARALDWNRFNAVNPFEAQMSRLKSLCGAWQDAMVVMHDVWSISAEVLPGGSFQQVDSKTRRKRILMDARTNQPSRFLDKKMSNYFSLGVESRIGIGFDKRRTTSQLRNKLVYVTEGAKKMLFQKQMPIGYFVTRLKVGKEGPAAPPGPHQTRTRADEDSSASASANAGASAGASASASASVDAADGVITADGAEENEISFDVSAGPECCRKVARCASLIALNIPSFSAGNDLWVNAGRVGVDGLSPSEEYGLLSSEQIMGDGMLEWVSFETPLALGAEQAFHGRGRRIHQGGGPYVLEFDEHLPPNLRIYFQVDGEFFQMQRPIRLRLSLYRQLKCLSFKDSPRQCYRLPLPGQ